MINRIKLGLFMLLSFAVFSCNAQKSKSKTAKDLLGNPKYQAICYSGYRTNSTDVQPTVAQVKEDLKILEALNIKIVRTYKTKFNESELVLKAISELKKENPKFEMYMMLGVWINCENAFSNKEPNHNAEDVVQNSAEINEAVRLTQKYPDIVKIIAVGNEAMVKWATSYYVQPNVILKWVNHLQNLKKSGDLSKNLWITSSDNFAAWGGGSEDYKVPDLEKLIKAVDYVSMHTYPMHDTHYNPEFWKTPEAELQLPKLERIEKAMKRAENYSKIQYKRVTEYVKSIDANKTIHIGETGWASSSDGFYGNEGSKACDEFKEKIYYDAMRNWTDKAGITCFYFEAFDEVWKDAKNPAGSENHFGLFDIKGKAKFVLWDKVDAGLFKNLKRDGAPISKTFNGNKAEILKNLQAPE